MGVPLSTARALASRSAPPPDEPGQQYTTSNTGPNEPKWITNRNANITNSILHELPAEIFLEIRDHLDDHSIQVLRQLCSRIRDAVPARARLGYTQLPLARIPPYMSDRHNVALMLSNEALCEPCLWTREYGFYADAVDFLKRSLWCSKCSTLHRAAEFSVMEDIKPRDERQCIAFEGRLRLCEHVSVGWSDVEKRTSWPMWPWKRRDLVCKQHPESDGMPTMTIKLAPHQDNGEQGVLIGSGPHRDNGKQTVLIGSKARCFVLALGAFTPVTRKTLRESLEARRDSLRGILCPHVSADDARLLLPFGPDACACFDYEPFHLHRCEDRDRCCRCRADDQPRRQGVFMPAIETPAGQSLETGADAVHRWNCLECDTVYRWEREGENVFINIERLISQRGPPTSLSPWTNALDPESWGAHLDIRLKSVACCGNNDCARRRGWTRLMRLLHRRHGLDLDP